MLVVQPSPINHTKPYICNNPAATCTVPLPHSRRFALPPGNEVSAANIVRFAEVKSRPVLASFPVGETYTSVCACTCTGRAGARTAKKIRLSVFIILAQNRLGSEWDNSANILQLYQKQEQTRGISELREIRFHVSVR